MSITVTAERASSTFWLRDLLILSVALVVLFGWMLGSRALGVPDEARYAEIAREMVVSGDYLTPRLNGVKYFEKPPLFYWLQAASIKLFGTSEWALRLWTALFALLGGIGVYAAGRILFDRRTGLISATVLSTCLLYYGMARAVTLDMAVSVFMSLGLFMFLIATRLPPGGARRLSIWAFSALMALAVLTKGLIGIVLPGLVIAVWIALLGEWRILKTLYIPSGLIIFLLIAVPWHVMAARANPEFLQFYFIHEHFQRFLTDVHHRYQPFWFFAPVLLFGMLPWSIFLVQAIKHHLGFRWGQRHLHKETLFLLLWAGLVFAFFSASHSKLVPYILPVVPPLVMLIGSYLAYAADRRDTAGVRAGYWLWLVNGSVLVVGLGTALHYRAMPLSFEVKAGLTALAVIAAAGMVAGFVLGRARGLAVGGVAIVVSSLLFFVALDVALPYLDNRSVKGLALTLKSRLEPQDEIVSYKTYYQDLPFYLGRRITVADWQGELHFGATTEDVSAWIIDDATFWRRWHGTKTVYMMTSRLTYQRLLSTGGRFNVVAQDARNVVLCNNKG